MSALGKEALLAYAGKFAEELVELEGIGEVLCRELSGSARAKVLGVLAPAASGASVDFGRYQELLLQLGLADPSSPPEARTPLFDMADAKKAMELGAGKVAKLCSTIERLSGLDLRAAERAEGNSGTTPSGSATSG